MRALALALGLGALSVALGPRSSFAQDAPAPETPEAARARASADLGRHFLVAAEAKLREGEALLRAGRTEEGLAALREIAKLLEKHEATVRGAGAAPARVDDPVAPRAGLAAWSGDSVAAALRWLSNHQGPVGSWSCATFQRQCRKNICDGRGSSDDYTTGTTALALLAFLGAGSTPRSGEYRDVVDRGVRFLLGAQSEDGCVGPKTGDGHFFYGHAIATAVLAEAYALSGSPLQLRAPAQKAVDYLAAAQNPSRGWRYGFRPGDNDTSSTAWAVLALRSAQVAGLTVPPECFEGARSWFDSVTDPTFFKTGYTQKGDNGARLPESQRCAPSEAMTAAAVACRIFMRTPVDAPVIRGGATLLRNLPPRWDPETGNDFYYWYWGTLASFQVGGETWRAWNPGLKEALVANQRHGGDEDGSWDPCDAWGSAGGRVYSTAMNTLSLEIYYRFTGGPGTARGAKREPAEPKDQDEDGRGGK